jgi:hypothetical protein
VTHSETFSAEIQQQAELILEPLDLSDDEVNAIVEEWCSYDFEIGQVTRCLAKLQRIAFEHKVKSDGAWKGYRNQFKNRPPSPGYALRVEQG